MTPWGPGPGTVFCPGDCSGAPAPCGNCSFLPPGDPVGALNSLGVGGRLRATGGTSGCTYPPLVAPSASLSNDDIVLIGNQMPNSSALYFQGTIRIAGGAGIAFGDGLRCAGGTVIRLGTKLNSLGASQYPAFGDPPISVQGAILSPGTRTYQVWYRNSAAFCTPATFNLTNGYELVWGP